jgi:hypothetical protein
MRPIPFPRRTDVGPFAVLLVTLVVTMLVAPLFAREYLFGISRFRIFATAVLCAGIYALSRRRRAVFLAGLAIALPALAAEAWLHLHPTREVVVLNFALTLAFLVFLGAALLHAILDQERVTLDTIFGGICVYLLLGVAWSLTYCVLEHLAPGSFTLDGGPLPPTGSSDEFRREELIYFSFVTLTTVGYGDVLARGHPARALAAAEAVTGSLYLAIFIARLVGLHMVHAQRRDLDL